MDLITLPLSPFSEKARWALDHSRLPYRERIHMPFVGEGLLRLRTRIWTSAAAVPALIDGSDVVTGALRIARYVEHNAPVTTLFPSEHVANIVRWNDLSEKAISAGRVLVTKRIEASPEAKREILSGLIPGFSISMLGHLLGNQATGFRLVEHALVFLRRKHNFTHATTRSAEDALNEVFGTLENAICTRPTLLTRFSFADIAMAAALQTVAPVSDQYLVLGEGIRACMTDDRFHTRYPKAIAWRNMLYRRYRLPAITARGVSEHTVDTHRAG